jgi:xanthine dehydrogenase large subunit
MAFFDNPDSEVSIKRSKALGEPPLLLGLSVWAAVKDALGSAAGEGHVVPLSLPATNEQILMRLSALKRVRQATASLSMS